MGTESKAAVWTRTIVIAAGGLVFLFPFVWMVSTSLTTAGELFKLPPQLIPNPVDGAAYERLFTEVPIVRWVLNSVGVSLAVTFLQVLSSAMAAYAFTRLTFRGRNAIFVLFLATLMVPFQVMVVPLFIELRYMGMLDSYWGLIIPEMAMPFGVFLLRQAFLGLPRELEEAAFMDGAGHIRNFFTLVLPLSKPAIATVAVFSFMGSWNNFLWPLIIINSPDLMTLPLGLSSLSSRFVTDWNLVLAGATISVLPIVAVFLFAQRYVLQGVAMSGLKG
ncbi:multiple sugar transport system permease protein [Cryobacterium mesophilum]|uniref:Carbohydrate ABC transporter permease n=1 Tax=Terrimesophilobacter mesophilus TaxID=433647 RepID=A0A4V3IA53_9MICO|nr:carbohydrate ABC transporter permease [Terrimesophilobacter mesophilus]MBB5632337.1 multiple sugar transport system permease protein [Terrimesophilobacter mesophilus]TFB79178.1 carbohydrate ABC transporter permease [Terrimesophilobacter mesophilus]